MRQVFILRYKGPNVVEAFESYDDAIDAGVEFITEMGACSVLSEDEINGEVSTFSEDRVCDTGEV